MCAEPRTLHARSMRTVPGGSPAERPGARALTLRCPSVFDEHLLPHLLDPTRSERSVLLCVCFLKVGLCKLPSVFFRSARQHAGLRGVPWQFTAERC